LLIKVGGGRVKAFYGSRISKNQTRTPEGFLVCHNVPIARTGWQEYLGQEIGLNDYYDQPIKVYRSPEEVFSKAAMASFEGKSVTSGHPSTNVRPDNYNSYEKGQVTNVRKGQYDLSDLLLADLIMKDPSIISDVDRGKREVSCGYDCLYEPIEDGSNELKFKQVQIRGNHVAVVSSGRAGSRVSIQDQKPLERGRGKGMKIDKNTLVGRILASFAKDADPEELAQASQLVSSDGFGGGEQQMQGQQQQNPVTLDVPEDNVAMLTRQVQELTQVVKQLVENDQQPPKVEHDSLSALENSITKGMTGQDEDPAENEESVTVPPEEMESKDAQCEHVITDRNSVLAAIRAAKPVIASISDPVERKRVSDALAKSFKAQMGVKDTSGFTNYAAMQSAIAANAAKTNDSQPDQRELGRDWAKKHNPHYKNRA